MAITRLDYCHFLWVTQRNFTLTYFAKHRQQESHDTVNRFLERDRVTPNVIWESVKEDVQYSTNGYVAFDDTVIDKNYSWVIELVRKQYSGCAHRVIRGIGVVTCLYFNPELNRFWIIDYRIFDPNTDGKSKLDHVQNMLTNIVQEKKLDFRTVLMDSWYAVKEVMLLIEQFGKIYYCPVKKNRLVDDVQGKLPYRAIEDLQWSADELEKGKIVKIKSFPKFHKVRLFRVVSFNGDTEYVVTNNITHDSTEAIQKECSVRWKIEELHRQLKQTTGIESCQCRKARIQRNHIGCAVLVWVRMHRMAHKLKTTVYQLKENMLDNYMKTHLRNPDYYVCA